MIAAGLGGRGASRHRGRSAFMDAQLQESMTRLLALGDASCVSRDVVVDGRRLHFLEAGSGPPLLLLHGAGGGAANWYRLIKPLSQHWRVLAPDLPGFGFSDAIEPRAPIGAQVADIITKGLAQLGVSATDMVGTSFGGLVALRLAQRFPGQRVLALDSVGLTRLGWLLRSATAPLLARWTVRPSRTGTRLLIRHALTSMPLPRDHENALTDYLYASARRGDAAAMARAFTQFRSSGDVLDASELAALSTRLALVWGARDKLVPERTVQHAVALAGCGAVRIIPGAGHSPNWEQPAAVLQEIKAFLTDETEAANL
jgi:pimeloyl-ACP methyl ester carboxylesterase